jgi:hypothetical protein
MEMQAHDDDMPTTADCLELAALLKTEAVLRILKGRTTAEEEAARLQVDIATVATWLESTFRAIDRALDGAMSKGLEGGQAVEDVRNAGCA